MFDDYVLYLVESLHAEEKARELLNNISTDSPPDCSDPGFGGEKEREREREREREK